MSNPVFDRLMSWIAAGVVAGVVLAAAEIGMAELGARLSARSARAVGLCECGGIHA